MKPICQDFYLDNGNELFETKHGFEKRMAPSSYWDHRIGKSRLWARSVFTETNSPPYAPVRLALCHQ